MRTGLLSATALCTSLMFLLGPALAQQTPYDWTGPYVGMTVGVVQSNSTVDIPNAPDTFGDNGLPTHYDLSGSNVGAGLTAGYNVQNGNMVFGIEGDATGLGLKNTVTGTGDEGTYTVIEELQSLMTLRGRLGVVEGNALLYGTAGIAGGQASFSAAIGDTGDELFSPASASGFVVGPVLGAGVEYALTDKLSIKAEGKVFRLASLSGTGDTGKGDGHDPFTATYQPQGAMLSTGLNLHF